MTDQTAQEPTMEEILASIRRIISEDDAPAETVTAAVSPSEPESTEGPSEAESVTSAALMDEDPSNQMPASSDDDVLELTDTYVAPAGESIGDLDVSPTEPEPFDASSVSESAFSPEPVAASTPEPASQYDTLVGDSASASAASAFAGLTSSLRKPEPMDVLTGSGPTVDELARSLLRPMLKEWLDANLPSIVQAEVRREVERIARIVG